MNFIKDILTTERTFCHYTAENKKALLHDISLCFAKTFPEELDELDLLDKFIKREQLGTTAIGSGVAIPHVRLDNIPSAVSAFFKLETPINFDAPDDEPVDLIFAMIVPNNSNNQHLQILSEVSQILSQNSIRNLLRSQSNNFQLFNLLITSSYELTA